MEAIETTRIIDSTASASRDAVHMPVLPVVAGEDIPAGSLLEIVHKIAFVTTNPNAAIAFVIPCMPNIKKGERFYAFIVPGIVKEVTHSFKLPVGVC